MRLKIIPSSLFQTFPHLMHGFTTKELGADYDLIAVELKILVSQIYYVDQIHSNRVLVIDKKTELDELPQADALVTNLENVIIGVRTADCLPILLYDAKNEVVAAIHAGFKGLLSGVVQNTFQVLKRHFDSHPEDILVSLGPCIRVDRYEVGLEVIEQFQKTYGTRFISDFSRAPRPHLDLPGTAKMLFQDLGVKADQIDDLGLCTYRQEAFFHSYRRENGTGRQFNFIGMLSTLV